MIKINGKSVLKGQINGKEIQKIVVNGNTVWTSGPTFGRYAIVGTINGSNPSFSVFDMTTGTEIYTGNITTSITSMGNGKYKLNYNFISSILQSIIFLGLIDKNINDIKVTNLYLTEELKVRMYQKTLKYLKAINYNNNTVFETTAQGTSGYGSSTVTIPWNDTDIISQYWDSNIPGSIVGIEDISCRNGYATTISSDYYTQLECYTDTTYTTTSTVLQGVNTVGVIVFFE